ncbi:MAG: ankyrin repeat domain-containing protein [Bdellovibrionaceae bacterium]|nr:ankyrin repeat domain-containing protein [Pseudobdellovibrionaceae bacterium]
MYKNQKLTQKILFVFASSVLCSAFALAQDNALCKAVQEYPIDVNKVKSALQNGDDVNSMCKHLENECYSTRSAFDIAAKQADVALLLAQSGVDPDLVSYHTCQALPASRYTALAQAASQSTPAVLKILIKKSTASLEQRPGLDYMQFYTPLGLAIYQGKAENAQVLIDNGANVYNVRSSDKDGKGSVVSALSESLKSLPDDFVNNLYAQWDFTLDSAQPNDFFKLELSRKVLSVDRLKLWVQTGVNIKSVTKEHQASEGVTLNINALNYVFKSSSERNGKEQSSGSEILNVKENQAAIDYLLGLNLNINEYPGYALLSASAGSKSLSYTKDWLLKKLLDQGGNPNLNANHDEYSYFPLMAAAIAGNVNGVDLLVQYGAKINQLATPPPSGICSPGYLCGGTSLVAAVFMRQSAAALKLIDLGADVNIADAIGRTPYCLVKNQVQGDSMYDVKVALLKHQANTKCK